MQDLPEPDVLEDMKFVRDNPREPKDCPVEQVRLRKMRKDYRQNYGEFMRELIRLERSYLQARTHYRESQGESPEAAAPIAPSEWNGKGPCPMCKREAAPVLGEDECIAKVERWLKEQGVE